MTAFNPLTDKKAVQEYLARVGHITARRGRSYYLGGSVSNYRIKEPGRVYAATVVGELAYEVTLDFGQGLWGGECTCPVGNDCKHCAAALLGFQARATELVANARATPAPATPAVSKPKRMGAMKPIPRLPVVPAVPAAAPPRPPTPPEVLNSPFARRLIESLGRALTAEEKALALKVKRLYQRVTAGSPMTAMELRELAPSLIDWSWAALHLWPERPKDDYEFWLYCALELKRRGVALPAFTKGVCDLSEVEPRMRAWHRSKEVQQWIQALQAVQVAPQAAPGEKAEFRLVIRSEAAHLEWKHDYESEFEELKQAQVRRLAALHEQGGLELAPEDALLWTLLHQTWDYNAWWVLKYSLIESCRILSRVLRQPSLNSRIVTEAGRPLGRSQDQLRLQVQPAKDENDDYILRLVRENGSDPGLVRATLPGRPTLYLTETELFEGPPPRHQFGKENRVAIPAPAVESQAGLHFITSLGVPLPPRVAARVRHVKVPVTVRLNLHPIYAGGSGEEAVIQIEARFLDGSKEVFGATGWCNPSVGQKPAASRPADDGLITIYDRSAQEHFPRWLDALGPKWNSYRQAWALRVTKKFPEQLAPWLETVPPGVEVLLDSELATLREGPVSGTVRLDVQEAEMDWFDLRVSLEVSDSVLSEEELQLLLNARGGYVRLGKKGWRRLEMNLTEEDDERLAHLGLNSRDFTAEPQRLHALQLADEAATKFLAEERVAQIRQRVGELKARVTPAVPAGIRAELRPYQVEGFHFLAYLSTNRFGGVLADDMGLGKTLETLTWLAWLRAQPRPEPPVGQPVGTAEGGDGVVPTLVVCPKSVMDNWRAEAERFLPGLRVRLWRGDDAGELAVARREADLIVINYAQLRSLSPEISTLPWLAAILDEAQYIKNPDSQTAQAARALRAEHRLALTGTPIENRLLDLWSIHAFAMPGILGNRSEFLRRFNQKDDPLARRRLAARVRPFLIRRTKGQVAQDLPDRIEEDILCEMEAEQSVLYRAEYKRARTLLLGLRTKQDLDENRFHFLTSLLRLRQICCHPVLVNPEMRQAESAKVNALVDLLEPLVEEGHKVLVFSQFVTMLGLLKELMVERQWPHFYLAGDTENRGQLVQEFQSAAGGAVFLISLKAGGFGLNLMAASYVVLFDPWWNPAVENQAIDRTHRIGQTNKVIAYRLVMKESIEEKIRLLQHKKAALAQEVLGEERFGQSLTLDDLHFLFSDDEG